MKLTLTGGSGKELLPLLFLGAVYPLIVYMKIYPSPFAGYVWENGIHQRLDFFGYGKSRALIGIALICLFLLLVRKRNRKPFKPVLKSFYPLIGFLFFASLSACLSENKTLSVWIGNDTYETLPVLFAYGVLLFYTYQVVEHKEQVLIVCKALVTGCTLSAILGILQFMDIYLIEQDWVQRLLLGRYYAAYAGEIYNMYPERASAALANPDIAGVYFSALLPVIILLVLSVEKKGRKYAESLLFLLTVAAMVMSGCRGVFLAVSGAILIMLPIMFRSRKAGSENVADRSGACRSLRNKARLRWMLTGGALLVLILGAGLVDILGNTGVIFGIKDEKPELMLTDIRIRGQHLCLYREQDYVEIDLEADAYRIVAHQEGEPERDITYLYDAEEEELRYQGYEELLVGIYMSDAYEDEYDAYGDEDEHEGDEYDKYGDKDEYEDEKYITPAYEDEEQAGVTEVCVVDGYCFWDFRLTEQGLKYVNRAGKTDSLAVADSFFDAEWDYIASGRIYIWSRTIPLLKNALFVGSGACTFATVFPQNDYVAKAKAFGMNNLIVSKADNAYLSVWVEHGLWGLLFLLAFFFESVYGSYRQMWEERVFGNTGWVVLSVLIFALSGLFLCSSVLTAPIYVLLLGMLPAVRGEKAKNTAQKI
ncbi:MAG: O-antigen ligase family protein [Lachnospiraceae bacterium]|nr:O-antigen ligase family protein [Lachnospiraceae bacterium]